MFFVGCVKQISWRVIPVFVEIGPNFDKNPSDWLKIPGDPDSRALQCLGQAGRPLSDFGMNWRIPGTKISPILTNKKYIYEFTVGCHFEPDRDRP